MIQRRGTYRQQLGALATRKDQAPVMLERW